MNKNIIFKDLSTLWLEKVSIGVSYMYERNLKSYVNHLNCFLGDLRVKDIKPYNIDIIIEKLSLCNPNTNKPMSKKVLKNIISTALRIFDFAEENEIILRNPAKNKKKSVSKNAPVKERLPIDDIQKKCVLNTYHRTQIAALIMLFCGLRRGEVIALEWSDIDFSNKIISVTKSAVRIDSNHFEVTAHTKNGRDRYVPIPENLLAYLRLAKYSSDKATRLIYPQRNGDLHTQTTWNKTWNSYQTQLNYAYYCELVKNANKVPLSIYSPQGIPKVLERFTAHQLRHTYCTMLYMAGVDLLTTSKLMGHSNVQITLEIYTHLDDKYKKLNISKFNEYLQNSDTAILLNKAI